MRTAGIIRIAERRDIPKVVMFNKAMALETEQRVLDEDVLEKGVKAIFDDPQKGFYLVSETEGLVKACLMITYEWSDWRNGTFWWIQSVYVEKDARRRGLFQGLYEHTQKLIKEEENIAGLRLYVEAENTRAQQTYEKLEMKRTNYLLFEASS